jgi:hypothetical protein
METYSPYFETIYDDPNHSILRARVTDTKILAAMNTQALYYDFCLIWDDDHDTRVIEVIEKLYDNRMLFSLDFVGEREAFFTGTIRSDMFHQQSIEYWEKFGSRLEAVTQGLELDPWASEIAWVEDDVIYNMYYGMIDQSKHYYPEARDLKSIREDWRLGVKTPELMAA